MILGRTYLALAGLRHAKPSLSISSLIHDRSLLVSVLEKACMR